ncbi:MAG: hypothetical protein JHC58_01225 [Ilumatobacteraceae bacterium]|nr:hypothetical protein [Ilumatobacteraceae bacterium]
MATSSSAKKIARLAEASKNRKGRKVRMQGGSLFPTMIFVIVVLGVGLIAYARQSQERVSALDTAKQTYYTAFGIYKCDAFIENLPDATQLGQDIATVKPGAFIESPGVVRWEPQVLSGERRAKLETIFELYGLKVTNDSIEFPSTLNNGEKITEIDTKCGDKDATVQVVVWDTKAASSKVSIAELGNVRLTGNGMAITLAFVAKDVEVPQPVTVTDLDLLITG